MNEPRDFERDRRPDGCLPLFELQSTPERSRHNRRAVFYAIGGAIAAVAFAVAIVAK
jgi:hypothetical protein